MTFTLTTTAAIPASRTSIVAITFSLMPLVGLFLLQRRTPRADIRRHGIAILALFLTFTLVSCGGGLQGNGGGGSGSPGTPAGTYIISVTAICGPVTHSAQVSLTVNP